MKLNAKMNRVVIYIVMMMMMMMMMTENISAKLITFEFFYRTILNGLSHSRCRSKLQKNMHSVIMHINIMVFVACRVKRLVFVIPGLLVR